MEENSIKTHRMPRQRSVLIIGLGGTGKQILLNLRKMFFEHYGRVTLPHVANLWIDTDTRSVSIDGRPMDFLMREVDFTELEKVPVGLKKEDLKTLYDHPEAFPEIFSWFDHRLMSHGELRDGAGGIRSFGRLAFFRHYEKITNCILAQMGTLDKAATHNECQRELGIELEGGETDIWLVFSNAGGTGSGMFLDVAFALKEKFPNSNLRAAIVLPSVFSNDFRNRCFGNAYAALMELEHYTYMKDQGGTGRKEPHAFNAAWTREDYESGQKKMRGPVFDVTYLIGNQPAGRKGKLTLEDKDDLCRMVAESLYIEYAPSPEVRALASERNSSLCNFGNALNRVFTYPNRIDSVEFKDWFACRYASLGLSKIHIPVNRVKTLACYRLSQDLVDYWTDEQPIPDYLDEQINNEYLHRVGADNSDKHQDFYQAMNSGKFGERLTSRLKNLIWSDQRSRFIFFASTPNIHALVNQWTEDTLISQLVDTHAVKDRRGALAKSVAQNHEQHFQSVMADLHDLIIYLMSQPGRRFDVTRETLRRIRDRLLRDREHLEKAAANSRKRSSTFMQSSQTKLQWLDGLKGAYTRSVVVEVALEEIEFWVTKQLQAQQLDSAARLADRVATAIGVGETKKDAQGNDVVTETGLIKQLADYRTKLRGEVKALLQDRIDALSKPDRSPFYQDLGDGEAEIDRFYVDAHDRPVVAETLGEWERRFFEEQAPHGPTDLWDMRKTLASEGAKGMMDRLLTFSRSAMSHLQEKTVDVLARMADRYGPDSTEYEQVVESLIGYGKPWLAEPDHFVDGQDGTPLLTRSTWFAAHQRATSEPVRRFEDLLKKKMQHGYKLVSTSPDRVYAYSEVAGFPLMVIPDLPLYRNKSYFPLLEKNEALHTDVAFEKFQDLLIMQEQDARAYIQGLRTFLKAIILSIVETKQDILADEDEMLQYNYQFMEGLFLKEFDLGTFSEAVRRLSLQAYGTLLTRLKGETQRIEGKLFMGPPVRWYVLLEFHGRSPQSYFSKFPGDHAVRALLRDEAHRVLEACPNMESTAMAEFQSLKRWTRERPRKSGLYVMQIE